MLEWFVRTQCTRRLVCLNAVWLIGATCSCAPKVTGPETYPATGIVTLDGTPVEGADITFIPSSSKSVIGGGSAVTNDDGYYEATIFVDGGKSTKLGLPAGEYYVEVVKLEHVDGDASLSKPPRNVLPARYGSVKSSELKVTVKSAAENQNDFHLKR